MCIEILASFGSAVIAKQHPKPVIISNSCWVLYWTILINFTTGVPFSYLFIKTYWALYQKYAPAWESYLIFE